MAANRRRLGTMGTRLTGIWVLVMSLFIVELLFYAWSGVQCVRVGIATGQQSKKAEELKSLQNSLKIELARLKAPERISHIARKQLSLEMPEPRQVIVLP